jgi:hypothetical protein
VRIFVSLQAGRRDAATPRRSDHNALWNRIQGRLAVGGKGFIANFEG